MEGNMSCVFPMNVMGMGGMVLLCTRIRDVFLHTDGSNRRKEGRSAKSEAVSLMFGRKVDRGHVAEGVA